MKASEMIQQLQKEIEKMGDCEVVVRDIVNGINYDICSIGLYAHAHEIHVEV